MKTHSRRRGSLLVNPVDESFFFQFHDETVVDNFTELERHAGFARQRLFDLNLHSFPGRQRHAFKKFGISLIAGFEVSLVILPRVFGEDFLALLFLRFEKMGRLDQGHHDPLDDGAVGREITLGRGDADVGKRIGFLEIAHADEDAVRHALRELDGAGRRSEARDPAGAESRCPFRRAADLKDRDVLDRKSTRLNSSHGYISYAVFCLKKKKKQARTY